MQRINSRWDSKTTRGSSSTMHALELLHAVYVHLMNFSQIKYYRPFGCTYSGGLLCDRKSTKNKLEKDETNLRIFIFQFTKRLNNNNSSSKLKLFDISTSIYSSLIFVFIFLHFSLFCRPAAFANSGVLWCTYTWGVCTREAPNDILDSLKSFLIFQFFFFILNFTFILLVFYFPLLLFIHFAFSHFAFSLLCLQLIHLNT